jgi:hypothetical protein
MNTRKRMVLLGMLLTAPCVTALAAPAALAATASGPALMTHGGDAPAHAVYQGVTTASATGMPSWEIALIAIAAALVIGVADRALTRARAARRPAAGPG